MLKDPAMIYAKLQRPNGWEQEEKNSYNAQKLADDYREQLYSEKAKRMLLTKTEGALRSEPPSQRG